MFRIKKSFSLNFKIFKFLLITPIFFLVTLFTNISESKAGLEFQWDQDSGYKRLKWFQKENTRKFRNTIYFFLRPSDRKDELLKININFKIFKFKKEFFSILNIDLIDF